MVQTINSLMQPGVLAAAKDKHPKELDVREERHIC